MTTAADVAAEYLTPTQVSESFGSAGGRPRVPYSTVIRWIREGFRLPTGEVVRLAAEQIGGRIWVRRDHLDAFTAVVSRPAVGPGVAPTESPAARKKRMARERDEALKLLRG